MGEDLCLNWVILEEYKTEIESSDLDERRNVLLAEVDLASPEILKHYYNEKDEDIPEDIEEMKRQHKMMINNFFNSLNYRDVSWINHKGDRLYITGGMSYGDLPTDSCSTFEDFNYISPEILGKAKIKCKKNAEAKLKEIEEQLKQKDKLKDIKGKAKFFLFDQNNSGGHFDRDKDVCENVIIEAYSIEDANLRADNFGIYFDGCSQGMDCSCCGDRWSKLWDKEDGTEEPMISGDKVREHFSNGFYDEQVIIHYLNGTKERIIFKTSKDCPKHEWEQQYDIGKQCKICHKWENEK